MNGRLIIIFVLEILLVDGCKDRFDIKVSRTSNTLVVNGRISDGPGPHFLKLGTTTVFQKEMDPLIGALVSVTDENGLREYYRDIGKGNYQLDGKVVKGAKGKTYVLEIQRSEGKHYISTPETMASPQADDNAYFKVVREKTVSSEGVEIDNTNVNIYLNTTLPGATQPGYLRWGIDEVYCIIPTCVPGAIACPPWCYIYQPVSKFNLKIVDTSNYQELSLKDILLQTRSVDFTFLVRHYFNITQYSMNPAAFEYWKKVELLTARNGSIFDTPPAVIQGNVHNTDDPGEPVFGYFEASAQKLVRVAVDKGYIPVELNGCEFDPYAYFMGGSRFSYCTNCYAIPGSTTAMPEWFF